MQPNMFDKNIQFIVSTSTNITLIHCNICSVQRYNSHLPWANCSRQVLGNGCSIGCVHLLDSLHPRPGRCPTQNQPDRPPLLAGKQLGSSAGGGSCSADCRTDDNCADPLHKCCPVGCGQSCVPVGDCASLILTHTVDDYGVNEWRPSWLYRTFQYEWIQSFFFTKRKITKSYQFGDRAKTFSRE